MNKSLKNKQTTNGLRYLIIGTLVVLFPALVALWDIEFLAPIVGGPIAWSPLVFVYGVIGAFLIGKYITITSSSRYKDALAVFLGILIVPLTYILFVLAGLSNLEIKF